MNLDDSYKKKSNEEIIDDLVQTTLQTTALNAIPTQQIAGGITKYKKNKKTKNKKTKKRHTKLSGLGKRCKYSKV